MSTMSADIYPREPWRRCETLWYDDGSVVLEASGVMFRVFRGMLARQSSVFRDMFLVPQGGVGIESFEGLPLVHMPDDKEDLEYFLRALHEPSYYRVDAPIEFRVLEGILRLASKYNVTYLRQRCIADLSQHFPTTLQEYMTLYNKPAKVLPHHSRIPLINIAREVGALALLPSALYEMLFQEDRDIVWDGTTLEDGRHVLLNETDKRAVFLASLWVDTIVPYHALPLLAPGSLPWTGCVAPQQCEYERARGQCDFSSSFGDIMDPDQCNLRGRLCLSCSKILESALESVRQRIWDELPDRFGLPIWERLREEAEAESGMHE